MKHIKHILGASLAALLLASCGGGGAGDQTPKVSFTGYVNFGDSLSDLGSYKVGTVAALGGGRYTVNSPGTLNWTEIVARQYALPAPCVAQTGLDGLASQGFSVPVVNTATCFSYAQGGARVTNPVGPGNKLLGGGNAVLGQLTVPVLTQINNHLAKVNGSFTGRELVTVMAGGNDLFIQGGTYAATAAALNTAAMAGQITPAAAQAQLDAAGTTAVTEMGKAGAELAGYVKALIAGKGARNIVVVNLPNVSKTPYGISQGAQGQGFIDLMTTTFNAQLKAGLNGVAGVVYVDAYTESTTQANNPAPYGLTNVTATACDLTAAKNPLGSSLVCTPANLKAGDVSRYAYADDVHPSPYGYELLAKFVLSEMVKAGLL